MNYKFWSQSFILFSLVNTLAFIVHAQDSDKMNENKLKTEDVTKPVEKTNVIPDAEEVDKLVTNNFLRAYSGSTSKWSIASTFIYNGSTIDNPFDEDRPNIAASTGTISKATLHGQISVKYNLDAKNSLMVGAGIRWIAPLQPKGPTNYNGATFDADNPYLQYQYIYRWANIQSVLQVQGTGFTNSDLVAEGYVAQANIDQVNVYEIGNSGLSIGAEGWVQYQWFNKTGPLGDPGSPTYMPDVQTDQSDYAFGLFPQLEYQITKKVNFRTVFGLWSYEHVRAQSNPNTYITDKPTQSVGLGYSVTRDIFLYPNVQFLLDNIQSKMTNVGLNATINVF